MAHPSWAPWKNQKARPNWAWSCRLAGSNHQHSDSSQGAWNLWQGVVLSFPKDCPSLALLHLCPLMDHPMLQVAHRCPLVDRPMLALGRLPMWEEETQSPLVHHPKWLLARLADRCCPSHLLLGSSQEDSVHLS